MSRPRLSPFVSPPLPRLAQANPVLDAARQLGTIGLSDKPTPATSPTSFWPSGKYTALDAYLKPLFDDPTARSQVRELTVKLIEEMEKEAKPKGLSYDASVALAYAVLTISTLVGKTTGDADAPFFDFVKRLQASLDRPEVRRATDGQKQELYENCMGAVTFALTLAEAKGSEAKSRLKEFVDALLTQLIGAGSDRLAISAKSVRLTPAGSVSGVTGTVPAPAPTTAPAPPIKGLAPGFGFTAPPDWKKQGDWYIRELPDGPRLCRALFRLPSAIPARGNMGDALRALWVTEVPQEGKNSYGNVVYRRYVGDKVLAQFIGGRFIEQKRPFDSFFTLFLVDCKSYWQPIVLALTYESSSTVGGTMSSGFSFPGTMIEAEKFLATITCPAARAPALADASSLAGDYGFGSGTKQDWVNIYTGATSMTYLTTGGSLTLKPDGTFVYLYSSAAGRDGTANFRGAKGTGTWTIQEDILVCTYKTYDQGDGYKVKEHRYRIAGLTVFPDGVKIAILVNKLDMPINLTTLGDSSYWYSTKKSPGK